MADDAKGPPPEAEKAGPRLYKGEAVTLDSLQDKRWAIVQPVTREARGRKLPIFMVVENVLPSWVDRKHRSVTFLDPRKGFARDSAEIPQEAELRLLTGRMGAELKAELSAWGAKNLTQSTPKVQMKVGADPEMFVEDKDGVVIPAFKFLGSKKRPDRVELNGRYNNIYWDGFQAEFDLEPDTCLAWVNDRIQNGLRGLHELTKGYQKKARLSPKTVLPIPMSMLADAADEHVEFGCAPSMNVYGLEGRKVGGRELPVRFAGGHIHFGFHDYNGGPTALQPGRIERTVKALDAILGVAGVSLFAEFDNPVRREFYGLPGEYRLPAHGMEYRTLSNAWLFHPVISNLVLDLSRRAFSVGWWDRLSMWKAEEAETIEVIKASDVPGARKILERNKDMLTGLFNLPYYGSEHVAYSVVLNGMESAIKDPEDIADNWDLERRWTPHCDGPNKNWRLAWASIEQKRKV